MNVAIDERIGELVAAHREELAELVRQALDRELQALVDVELDAALGQLAEPRANGAAPTPTSAVRVDPTTEPTPLCSSCGERPAAGGRRVCERCRSRGRRARAAGAGEAPRTGPAAEDPDPLA